MGWVEQCEGSGFLPSLVPQRREEEKKTGKNRKKSILYVTTPPKKCAEMSPALGRERQFTPCLRLEASARLTIVKPGATQSPKTCAQTYICETSYPVQLRDSVKGLLLPFPQPYTQMRDQNSTQNLQGFCHRTQHQAHLRKIQHEAKEAKVPLHN